MKKTQLFLGGAMIVAGFCLAIGLAGATTSTTTSVNCTKYDLNSDGKVTDADQAILDSAFGYECDAKFNKKVDFDNNWVVNSLDQNALISHYGWSATGTYAALYDLDADGDVDDADRTSLNAVFGQSCATDFNYKADFNKDCVINILDKVLIRNAASSTYDVLYDLDVDGDVDDADKLIVDNVFGKTCGENYTQKIDFNYDCVINIIDKVAQRDHFGRTASGTYDVIYDLDIDGDVDDVDKAVVTAAFLSECDPAFNKKADFDNNWVINILDKVAFRDSKCLAATTTPAVTSITLTGSSTAITWTVNGYSAQGFKVVWSKTSNPTYPTRSGDQYHYYSDPNKRTDTLTAFAGTGTYYVRVCEYLGGKCGVYSNEISVSLVKSEDASEKKVIICHVPPGNASNAKIKEVAESAVSALLAQGSYLGECKDIEDKGKKEKKEKENSDMNKKAKLLHGDQIGSILEELKELRDLVREQAAQIKYLKKLTEGIKDLTQSTQDAINNFITYGVDDNTKKLGEGERAAVMHSYKKAFSKLPETEAELEDAIRIANGRWPSLTNGEAEKQAKAQFEKIYKRIPDMNDPKDNAAVTVMAYGLRQKAENRNLNSEKNGIKIFKGIFGKNPESTEEWNIMQAITYSGATRGVDTDHDLLIDTREAELGTNPNKADTDGDGFLDGIEVANGFDPLNK